MGLARYWNAQTLASNAFRFVTWVYLRVIPSPKITTFIPVLYALYLGTWISAIVGPSKGHATVKLEKSDTDTAEGNDAKDSLQNGDTKLAVSSPPPPHGTLSTVAFSLPTSSLSLRGIIFLINTLLLLCTIDFITHPTREPATSLIFTRLGAVDPDGAKVVVRWPEADQGVIRVVWREAPSGRNAAWKNGPVIILRNETDWVGVGRIGGLWPSTTYQYRLAYKNSTHLPYPDEPISFRTFPDPRLTTGNQFKFVVSSCMMPNFPYMAFKGNRIKGFDLLSDYIRSSSIQPTTAAIEQLEPIAEASSQAPVKEKNISNKESASPGVTSTAGEVKSNDSTSASFAAATSAPVLLSDPPSAATEFMLLLGDFVYADVPSYGGDNVESYRRLYRRVYASPSFRKVYERLPIFNIYDDHDIINNFVGQSNKSTKPFPNAASAYSSYNGEANFDPLVKGGNYYEFRYGDVAFFVLDARLYRSGTVTQEGEKSSMLGEQQLSALYEWLDRVNTTTTFKFIVSSVPFTSLWTHDAQVDSWAGYLDERDALLTVLSTIPNVFVLSGDRHEFAAIEYLGGKVVEFSTSPFSMFYIPIVRTLRSRSKALVEKWVQKGDLDEAGQEVFRQELELVPKEKVLKYLPLGNYKWSAFEIDTTDRQKPTLKLEVVINGRTEWRHTIIGEPVELKASSALGTQITRGLKGALGKIGLSPTKWF